MLRGADFTYATWCGFEVRIIPQPGLRLKGAQLVERNTLAETNRFIKEGTEDKAPVRLPGLKFLRTLWLCAISGGPFQYAGEALADAHFEFELTPAEFDEVAGVLSDSLDHFGSRPTRRKRSLARSPRTSRQ